MRITETGWLVALMTSIVCASCVIDNSSGPLAPADDDDSAIGDDDVSDDDAVVEDEVCPGSGVAFWSQWFRDVDGDGCLSRFERDDLESDPWVGVATCVDGSFATQWSSEVVEPGLPGYPFLDPSLPENRCEEVGDGDDDASDDDDVEDDDDSDAGDDDSAATEDDDDVADDDDATGDPPDTSDEVCEGGWVIQWTRWWLDVDNDSCLDATESDSSSSDPWIDVATCSSGAVSQYAYWEFQTGVWVNGVPEDPFLPGTPAYACP